MHFFHQLGHFLFAGRYLNVVITLMVAGCNAHEKPEHSDPTLKPGWKDIFRMNQNELELEIRKVSQNPELDPRRKDYLIQNLMTR